MFWTESLFGKVVCARWGSACISSKRRRLFIAFGLPEGHNQIGSSVALRGLYKNGIPGIDYCELLSFWEETLQSYVTVLKLVLLNGKECDIA